MAERERLQKLMSQAGIASRRDAEAYLIAGRVMINGQVARLGDRADLDVDDVRIDGEPLQKQTHFTYIMVNKPMQVVTAVTRQYQEKRQTVRDLINYPGRLFPVGRLDADSEGLVLMTNDGDMAERLTHPRFEHDKVYDVLVRGDVTGEQLAMWQRGVVLDDGQTLPAEVRVTDREAGTTRLRITMREGRKRQIRRIAVMLGHPVVRLLRIQIGPILLGNLRPGEWRELTKDEIDALKREAGTAARRVRRRSRTPLRAGTARPAAPNNTERSARSSPYSRPVQADRSERPDRAEHSERSERPERSDAPRTELPTGGHRSSPTRPSRMKHKRAPEATAERTERSGHDEPLSSERGPLKRPVAPPSRARSKPPSPYAEHSTTGKRRSPSAAKAGQSARPDRRRPDRPTDDDSAKAGNRAERRAERRRMPAAESTESSVPFDPSRPLSTSASSAPPAPSTAPRKPRKRPESANRSQKPSKASPHSGSRSQGGRPKKVSSTDKASDKPGSASRIGSKSGSKTGSTGRVVRKPTRSKPTAKPDTDSDD